MCLIYKNPGNYQSIAAMISRSFCAEFGDGGMRKHQKVVYCLSLYSPFQYISGSIGLFLHIASTGRTCKNTVFSAALWIFVCDVAGSEAENRIIWIELFCRNDQCALFIKILPAAPQLLHSVLIPFPSTSTISTDCSLHFCRRRL